MSGGDQQQSHVKVASQSYGHHMQREHALTEMVRTETKTKTKTLKNSDDDHVNVYHRPMNDDAEEDDDDDDEMDDGTVVGMEAPDMLITGNEDDELEALNYDDGDGDGDGEHTVIKRDTPTIIAIKPGKKYTFDSYSQQPTPHGFSPASITTPITPITPITPTMGTSMFDDEALKTLRILFANNDGFQLLMTHCASEWSIENILALIEIDQFRAYCTKQTTFIEQQLELRKKHAKERTAKKRQSILLRKRQKQQEIEQLKSRIQQPKAQFNEEDDDAKLNLNADDDSDQYQTGHRRQTYRQPDNGGAYAYNNTNDRQKQALVRRRQRLRQNQIDAQLMDEHEVVQHAFESRPPIQTAVSRTLQFMHEQENFATHHFSSSEHANGDDGDGDAAVKVDVNEHRHHGGGQEEKKSMEDTEAAAQQTYVHGDTEFVAGVYADDEDDTDVVQELLPTVLSISGYYDIIDVAKLQLPTSTIVNRPFIHSKNKRIRQLECIIMDLCNKYVLCASHFQLNLPAHISQEVKIKIQAMKAKHEHRVRSHTQHRRQPSTLEAGNGDNHSNDHNDDDDDDDDDEMSAGLFPAMQSTESSFYPENHEKLLPMFFDEILEVILRLISDSLSRLKATEKFSGFINFNSQR